MLLKYAMLKTMMDSKSHPKSPGRVVQEYEGLQSYFNENLSC